MRNFESVCLVGLARPMTRYHIEKMARDLADTRHELWVKCGPHNWATLLRTQDTGEHYCITCLTLFSSSGEPINPPQNPGKRRSGTQ